MMPQIMEKNVENYKWGKIWATNKRKTDITALIFKELLKINNKEKHPDRKTSKDGSFVKDKRGR